MQQTACSLLRRNRDILVTLKGDFDGFQAFEQLYDLLPPIGSAERIVLNFSSVARARVEEVYYMLTELAADPRFNDMEIDIQGLSWNTLGTRS